MVLWTFVALVAAAFVLVVAGAAAGRTDDRGTGLRGYVRDVRAGVRTLWADRRDPAAARAADGAVDTTIDDFFAATEVHDPAYLGVDDLTDTLARARERAARGVAGLSRR